MADTHEHVSLGLSEEELGGVEGLYDTWLQMDNPHDLATNLNDEYSEENRQRLADAACDAALAEVRPNPSYADVTARDLARKAVQYALGLKELPDMTKGVETSNE